MEIKFTPVESSNVKEIGYEENTLYVKYQTGTYVYEGVDRNLYEGLMKSDSKGRYLNEHIKGNFICKKL